VVLFLLVEPRRRSAREEGESEMRVIPPNSFGMAFGTVGLAGTWLAAADTGLAPRAVGDALLAVAAALWAVVLAAYAVHVGAHRGTLRSDLAHPVLAPFVSLAVITPMVLAARGVAPWAPTLGAVLVDVFLAATVLHGAWFTGQLIAGEYAIDQMHPGYFLPTVAGGLVASASAAEVGQHGLGTAMFGYGMICWAILGSMILARLFFRPALPPPLRPTLAIEVAPAAVASLAWSAVHGPAIDTLTAVLAGYGVLMVLAQVRLVPIYLRLPFGVGFWAFAFAWAAVATTALHWIAGTRPAGGAVWAWLVIAAVSLLIGGIAARSAVGLVRGTLFARPVPEPLVAAAPSAS
jgi:tellurite resistance protein